MSKRQGSIDKETLSKVSKKLKELRIKAGYTSYETFAHDFELDRKQYWRMENGANITLNSLLKLVVIHKLSLREFFKEFK